jgi:peptidoglycan/xylan/chitin deacetylase (PgdA/CDA1 family)
VPFRFARPVISLTFDDYPRSALDLGGHILASEGLSATYHTAFGLANTSSASGTIGSLDDLAACVAAGHEVACHSFDHVDCYRTSPVEFARNLDRNRETARTLGLPPLRNFAYPFGRFGVVAKRVVMQSYFSARTTMWGVNRSGLDLGMLKSVPIYSRYEWRLSSYLDELQSRKGWLILYTHDVSCRPSPYGCTPDELSSVIRRARAIGALILPVGAVVDRLREAPLPACSTPILTPKTLIC